jgi:hypothetical protein
MKMSMTLGAILLVLVIIFSVVWWYDLKVGCTDYLKLAGDAPTITKADEFLGKALEYMDRKNLKQGNSAVLFQTPSSDIGIWYEQIRGAKRTLQRILLKDNQDSISQLERDNALMKVREVVLDSGSDGTEVTTPSKLAWYPQQQIIALWWLVAIACIVIPVIIAALE